MEQREPFIKRNSHDQGCLDIYINCALVCAWLDESVRRLHMSKNRTTLCRIPYFQGYSTS